MTRIALTLLLLGISMHARSGDGPGLVCLGSNLAKPADEHTKRLFLRIGDSEKIYFLASYDPPKVVASGLNPDAVHTVEVYFDGVRVQSWPLDFKALGARGALIWRGPGAWRMEAIDPKACVADTRPPPGRRS